VGDTHRAASVSDGSLSVSRAVTITVTDVNERPELPFLMWLQEIEEQQASGTLVDSVCADNPETTQTLTYSLVGTTQFGIGSGAPAGCAAIVSTLVFNYETLPRPDVNFNISVCDNGSPQLCTTVPATVYVADVNEAPSMAAVTVGVTENALGNVTVGSPLVAVDPDFGDPLTFTIVSDSTITNLFYLVPLTDRVVQVREQGAAALARTPV
jgi:hypothetical protein